MMQLVKFLIADDHVIVRNGIRYILERQNEFIPLIQEARNGEDCIDMIHQNEFDLVLLDIQMPKVDGIAVLQQIKELGTSQKFLILSANSNASIIKQSISYGCDGYLSKDISSEELLHAISTVLSGESYFSNLVSQVLLKGREIQPQKTGLEGLLTPREFQVLKLVAEELSHREIAAKLQISTRTVEGHKKSLKEKLNVKGAVGLTKYAIRNGIV